MNSIAEKSFLSGPKLTAAQPLLTFSSGLPIAHVQCVTGRPVQIRLADRGLVRRECRFKSGVISAARMALANSGETYDPGGTSDSNAAESAPVRFFLPPLRNELPPALPRQEANNRGGSQDFARESVRSTAWLGEAAAIPTLNGDGPTAHGGDTEEPTAASPNKQISENS